MTVLGAACKLKSVLDQRESFKLCNMSKRTNEGAWDLPGRRPKLKLWRTNGKALTWARCPNGPMRVFGSPPRRRPKLKLWQTNGKALNWARCPAFLVWATSQEAELQAQISNGPIENLYILQLCSTRTNENVWYYEQREWKPGKYSRITCAKSSNLERNDLRF